MILWSHISKNTSRTLLGPLKIMHFLQLFVNKHSRSIFRNSRKKVNSHILLKTKKDRKTVYIYD